MLNSAMKIIDDFLNGITMYRLVLYYLIFLLAVAALLSSLGTLAFSVYSLSFSTAFLLVVSLATNLSFARVFKAPTNIESAYITALILALIVSPISSFTDLPFLFWVGVLSESSKYIIAVNKKHLFNPAASAVALTALAIHQSASWWVGNSYMLPAVLLGGFLVVRKIRRTELVVSFLITALFTITAFDFSGGSNVLTGLRTAIINTPLFFLACVMLTEPLTSPPTKDLRMLYGALVGFLFAPQVHLGGFYTTPELALILGNIFSYLVSPKQKLLLRLHEKVRVSADTFDYIFSPEKKIDFTPGQYLEWTLEHHSPDSRGYRRYFTIASSPTEGNIRIGVRFNPNSSSFKKSLLEMQVGNQVMAGNLAGDFILPKDQRKKLVFVAGGIGITPFRSMLKYLLDKNERRDIIVLFSNRTKEEVIYQDILRSVRDNLGVKIIYTLTDLEKVPGNWLERVGRIDEAMIREEVPDFSGRIFYLSGPNRMVAGFQETLKRMGLRDEQIIVDYFPGFA